MLKKIMLSMFLLLPTFCWAWDSGFYLGAGLGMDSTYFDEVAHVEREGTFDVVNKTKLGGYGPLATIYGGYGYVYNNFYLAGEINGNMTSAMFIVDNEEFLHGSATRTNYKLNRYLGLSAVPGYLLTPDALFYLRLGYAAGHFRAETNDRSLKNDNTTLSGLRYGVGLEKAFSKNLGLRVEFSHINYDNTTSKVFIPGPEIFKQTNVSPQTNQVEFGLAYHFWDY